MGAEGGKEDDCPGGHAMEAWKATCSVICDGCGVRLCFGASVMGCRVCNWDLCSRCFSQEEEIPLRRRLRTEPWRLRKTGEALLDDDDELASVCSTRATETSDSKHVSELGSGIAGSLVGRGPCVGMLHRGHRGLGLEACELGSGIIEFGEQQSILNLGHS